MPSLNHVCMWSEHEHGWINITAEEAAQLHPGGTVHARSGLFMCALCGQYVTLTNGKIKGRYFKHSAGESNKNCDDRTFAISNSIAYSGRHELPLKIKIINQSCFLFEIGLIYIPDELLIKHNKEKIKIINEYGTQFLFQLDRLNYGSITYLPVDNEPSEYYELIAPDDLTAFWPEKVTGIIDGSAFFDSDNGKRLPYDSDVEINKKYYYLTNQTPFNYLLKKSKIVAEKICQQNYRGNIWYLYIIEAKELNELAATFFMNNHCRLTDIPQKMTPIWPIHVELPYMVKHSKKEMIIHISGQRQFIPETFPSTVINEEKCPGKNKGQVIRVYCNSKQQLITTGSNGVSQYFYYWNEALLYTAPSVPVVVKDGKDNLFTEGDNTKLPAGLILKIEAHYDGRVLLFRDNQRIEEKPLKAEKRLIINDVCFGKTVQIFQGLDLVWSCSFKKEIVVFENSDQLLFSKLISYKGYEIPVKHSIGALTVKLNNYPKTRQWLISAIKKGTAPANAIKYLVDFLQM